MDQVDLPTLQLAFPEPRRCLPKLLVHRAIRAAALLRGRWTRQGRSRALELLHKLCKVFFELGRREWMRVLLLGFYIALGTRACEVGGN